MKEFSWRIRIVDSRDSCQDCASCLADSSGAVLAEAKSTAYGDLGAKALPERLSRSWRLVRRSVAPSTDRKHSPGSVRAESLYYPSIKNHKNHRLEDIKSEGGKQWRVQTIEDRILEDTNTVFPAEPADFVRLIFSGNAGNCILFMLHSSHMEMQKVCFVGKKLYWHSAENF